MFACVQYRICFEFDHQNVFKPVVLVNSKVALKWLVQYHKRICEWPICDRAAASTMINSLFSTHHTIPYTILQKHHYTPNHTLVSTHHTLSSTLGLGYYTLFLYKDIWILGFSNI